MPPKNAERGKQRAQYLDAILRFSDKYTINEQTGCWEWHGSINDDGYGHVRDGQKIIRAHQYSYLLFFGEIPEDCELDHLCNNRICVNPKHLEAVSHTENVARIKGRKETKDVFEGNLDENK